MGCLKKCGSMPCCPCCREDKPPEIERNIKANNPEYNAQFKYANNHICTSKYNILTFLPLNLFEQFQRLANSYFLCLLILQLLPPISSLPWYSTIVPLSFVLGVSAIKDAVDDYVIPAISSLPWYSTLLPLSFVLAMTAIKDLVDDILIPAISSLTPVTTIVPLFSVLGISAIKDAVDDFKRHRSDAMVNNRLSYVLREGKFVEEVWHKVVVGDIIRMENNQFVAADLLLLSSSEPHSLCYIETAELDGETNLKVKQALPDTSDIEGEKLKNFNAEIVCEPPNNRLSKFEGTMKWNGESYSLDNEKILLRGCVLRNTKWCYGLVIFAGRDSKLMMNSGKPVFKRTHIDKLLNVLITGIFMVLFSLCIVMTTAAGIWETVHGYNFQVYLPWESYIPGSPDKEGTATEGTTAIALLAFFSYIIIFNTVVPISLYVSVEIFRLVNSLWINWDIKMYYKKNDTPAKARTTTLNEELGQIEYIFSDKTGTLTQNIMTFNKCCINNKDNIKSYGDIYDEAGNPMEITELTPKVDFSDNPYHESTFEFFDDNLLEEVRNNNANVHRFFRILCLCHTVMPEVKDDGKLEYQAQSPDEGALVSAARNFGFVFKSRTPHTITVEIEGQEEVYNLLCIMDFNNVRKRMSVVVKKDNKIQLLCKGADSVIFERLDPSCRDIKELTTHHLNEFAQDGLRTLCLAEKNISEEEWNQWKKKHHEASTSLDNREERVDALYNEIEQNLQLCGSTAIEDKLQDGVPECIANLAKAGIKIWVLTGDKQETAINIGYSCRLLTDEMEDVFVIDEESLEGVERQMTEALTTIKKVKDDNQKDREQDQSSNGGVYFNATSNIINVDAPQSEDFALVVNGHSLIQALKPEMERLLLELGCSCKAVICCRVTPLQKAMVVDLVKRNKKAVTLAIGDGANDVSMIKTAQIGVGISGQEGMQAVLASDYALAQFRFLERLLLVHGRWSYYRMCKFLRYFFYKNFAFTLCHLWFAFFCGYSAMTLFDPYFISFYNLFYTAAPVLVIAGWDQDVNDHYSLKYPKLYTPGMKDAMFNRKIFFLAVAEGIISSLILFFIPYGSFNWAVSPSGTDLADHQSLGVVVATTLVVAVTLRGVLDTAYWTVINHLAIWGCSIIYYFCLILFMYSKVFNYTYMGSAYEVFSSANFWLTMVLTNVVLLVPVIAYRLYFLELHPTLSDRVRIKQRLTKSKSRAKDVNVLRRASTLRRSTRSLRSGYAFAHQQGFGELITSGINMRQRVEKSESRQSVELTKVKKINGHSAERENTQGSSHSHDDRHVIFSEKL